jgi:5-oxoprolinase (ATP-hydrolysing)
MKTVFVSRFVLTFQRSSIFFQFNFCSFAGVLSALGLALADVVHEMQEPSGKAINQDNWSNITDRLKHLSKCGTDELLKQGYDHQSIVVEKYLNLRYEGTDCALMCTSNEDTAESFTNLFLKKYKDQFGFTLPDRPIIIDDIRVRALAKSAMNINRKIDTRSNDKPLKEPKVNYYCLFLSFADISLIRK